MFQNHNKYNNLTNITKSKCQGVFNSAAFPSLFQFPREMFSASL
jgi:hypothetical protein